MDLLPISEWTWNAKYRYFPGNADPETGIAESWRRVARAVASAEADADRWEAAFGRILADFLFLPGGRVMAGAGTGKDVTLFNCFVSGPIRDSVQGILESLKETALTMQQGGGIGCDFSSLRPFGAPAVRTGSVASGPLPFMRLWDALCETLLATSSRRGAMMGTLRCDHPDIETFVSAKRQQGVLTNFNLSVLVTDEFMRAVAGGDDWPLVYPAESAGDVAGGHERVYRSLPARDLWKQIVANAHETAEPGVLFIDTINRNNNLRYCETIRATNPCGEIPLPPYGACNLGSINLARLVQGAFTGSACFDWQRLSDTVPVAVRFLDDVIDVSRFPLDAQAKTERNARRIGLGITGLADMLAMLGLDYDSDEAREFAAEIMASIRDTAYETSVELARDKDPFPAFARDAYVETPFIRRLPAHLRDAIATHGIRNSHLLAIAPAGTISLLAGNVSSGVEPIYALEATRHVYDTALGKRSLEMCDFAYQQWQAQGGQKGKVPDSFVVTGGLPANAHLDMQACLQPYVDNAISKTVNLSANASVSDVDMLFTRAYSLGLKGCTVYRQGARAGQILRKREEAHCCDPDREAD